MVPYRRRYLRRVGSTNRDFSPDELARHILTRSGRSWDSLPSEWTLEEVDLEALREAVMNALIHRDYTYPEDIQIRLEEDRLEVWIPGEQPPPLTPEALYSPHSSVLRNPLIAQAFYFAGLGLGHHAHHPPLP